MQQQLKPIVASRTPRTEQDYLAIIEKIINTIGQEPNKIKVLSTILPFTLTLTGVEAGAFLVIDNEITNMVVVTKHGLPDEIVTQLSKGELGHFLLKGQPLIIRPQSQKGHPFNALLEKHHLYFLLGMPLHFEGHILGAIIAGSRKPDSIVPLETLQRRLATLAQIVAMYLDNVRLRTLRIEPEQPTPPADTESTETVDELEELLTAVMSAEEEVVRQNYDLGMLNTLSSQVGSSLQLSTVLDVAIKETRNAINAEAGWCYLFENDVLTLRGHQGLSDNYVQHMQFLKPGTGAEGMAFSRNEPIFRDGLLFHSGRARTIVKDEGLRTIAAIPLMNRNITFGVLAIGTERAETWSPRDERMLISISRQVAQAIANSQLFSDAAQKAQSWEAGYSALQEANKDLQNRNLVLEQHVRELHQAQRQIWIALAASSEARRQLSGAQAEKQRRETLKRILGKLGQDEEEPATSDTGNGSGTNEDQL